MEDHQEYLERVARLKREHGQALEAAARGIASHLDGWSYEEPTDERTARIAYLHGPSGQKLVIIWPHGDKRAEIRGELPKTAQGRRPFVSEEDLKRCVIGCNLRRSPKALARDIARRLLPAYGEVFEATREAAESTDAYHRVADELLEELAAIFDTRPRRRTDPRTPDHRLLLPDGLGSIETHGPANSQPAGAHLSLRLPGPLAREVLRLVRRRISGEGSSEKETPCL